MSSPAITLRHKQTISYYSHLWSIKLKMKEITLIELFFLCTFLIYTQFFSLTSWQQYYLAGILLIVGFLCFNITFRTHTAAEWGFIWLNFHIRRHLGNIMIRRTQLNHYNNGDYLVNPHSLCTIIELFAPIGTPVLVENGTAEYDPHALVPLSAIIDSLYQYDVHIDSIDIVNIGCKQNFNSDYDQVYSQLVPDSPAVGQRRTFILLTLKPQSLLKAIQHRGGGINGLNKTIHIISQRTLRLLKSEGISAIILRQDQLTDAVSYINYSIWAKVAPTEKNIFLENWAYGENNRQECIATYAIDSTGWTIENQNSWWKIPSIETAHMIHLTPAGHNAQDGAIMQGWIRYITQAPPAVTLMETSGLRLLYGQQKAAADLLQFSQRCSSSGKMNGRKLKAPNFPCVIPIGASGQYFGRTLQNKHFYLDLFSKAGTHLAPRIIVNNIDPRFLQQIALRALAVGAKIKIYSLDPAAWYKLIGTTHSPNIWIGTDSTRDDAQLAIYDRIAPQNESLSRTIISVSGTEQFPANVTIEIKMPDETKPTQLQINLGNKSEIIHWASPLAENHYIYS